MRKETVDILVTSRNGDRKIMQSIRVTSRPPYRRDLSWPHIDDEPRVQEKQKVKDQQSCILAFVACLTVTSSN